MMDRCHCRASMLGLWTRGTNSGLGPGSSPGIRRFFNFRLSSRQLAPTFARAGAGAMAFFGRTVSLSHCSGESELHWESRRSEYHKTPDRIPGLDPGPIPWSPASDKWRAVGTVEPVCSAFGRAERIQAWALDQVQGYGLFLICFSRRASLPPLSRGWALGRRRFLDARFPCPIDPGSLSFSGNQGAPNIIKF